MATVVTVTVWLIPGLAERESSIGVGDGGQGGHVPPPPKKKMGKTFFGQLLCKILEFLAQIMQNFWMLLIFRANIIKIRVF